MTSTCTDDIDRLRLLLLLLPLNPIQGLLAATYAGMSGEL